MKATVLVDNYVPNSKDLIGEPSFSCHVEHEGLRILFDLGFGKVPFDNARRMGLDLGQVDCLVLSHGHLDHSRGLETFIRRYKPGKATRLVCHPDALRPKRYKRYKIGIRKDEAYLRTLFDLTASRTPVRLGKDLVFLGEIARTNDFENKEALGQIRRDSGYEDDYLLDDSALAYDGDEGIVIITGCSHSGICNIMEQAKRVLGKDRIRTVIGGLHLQGDAGKDDLVLSRTLDYLEKQDIEVIYPCHCTNLPSKLAIDRRLRVGEIGSGTELEFR